MVIIKRNHRRQQMDKEPIAITFNLGLDTMADIEKKTILEALKYNNFNRTYTAKMLGISLRTIQRKIKRYEIDLIKNYAESA